MNLCTVFVFVSLVEFILISKVLSSFDHLDQNSPTTEQPRQELGEVIKSTQHTELVEDEYNITVLALPKTKEEGWRLAQKIDRASRIVFPALFAVLNVIYWIYYTVL